MEEVEWWEMESAKDLADQVAGDISFVIESAIEAHGNARIALAGGETPLPVYEALVKQDGIEWDKVTVIPTDDRLVGFADPASNAGKLARLFAVKGAKIVPLGEETDDYRAAGREADARLGELEWPLDLVLLGMGADGHTASIFPGPDFEAAIAGPRERRAVGVRPDPMPASAPYDRVTLTAAALKEARAIMIVIAGDEKKAVLEQAIEQGPLATAPVGRLLSQVEAAVDIFWMP